MSRPQLNVYSVEQLLSLQLTIPPYQRPYKWTAQHLGQLFEDLASFEDAEAYRLGTVVFHRNEGRLEIVDGQQRTLTLLLIVRALLAERSDTLEPELRARLNALSALAGELSFTSQISITNLQRNYQTIRRRVSAEDFNEARIEFLLDRCQVVCFALEDISEAFQFFDSQNARGRDLEPHDLLKAYHLREFAAGEATYKASVVAGWENHESAQLARLFENYLYRIRRWADGASARYFGKEDVGLFKGINLAAGPQYPAAVQLRMTHDWVDLQNRMLEQAGAAPVAFPFHLDQAIINGRRFFEMAVHYQRQVSALRQLKNQPTSLEPRACAILQTLGSYRGRGRTGDRYVQGLFDCLLIYYIDTFGREELSRAIEKAFIWAYRLRLERHAVHLATVDNHARENNLFRVIQRASRPRDFLAYPLPMVSSVRNEPELLALFKEMKFHA